MKKTDNPPTTLEKIRWARATGSTAHPAVIVPTAANQGGKPARCSAASKAITSAITASIGATSTVDVFHTFAL